MDIYDPRLNSWQSAPALPVPVGDCATATVGDSLLYVIGGGSSGQDLSYVQVYNPRKRTWALATTKPGAVGGGLRGAATAQGQLFIAGGYNQTNRQASADAWVGTIDARDPTQIAWSIFPPNPTGPFSRMAAVSSPLPGQEQQLYVLGGDPTGQGVDALNRTWRVDIATRQWTPLPTKPTAVSNLVALAPVVRRDSTFLAVIGGYDGSQVVAAQEALFIGRLPGPLPVQLTTFTAFYEQGYARLQWQTAQEVHNAGFRIEASADGAQFQPVGWVPAAADGYSTHPQLYIWQQVWPAQQTARYYRLVQQDLSGQRSYSAVQVVTKRSASPAISVFPNPVPPGAVIRLTGLRPDLPLNVTVTDAVGRPVSQQQFTPVSSDSELPCPEPLKPGVYWLLLRSANYQQTYQIQRQ